MELSPPNGVACHHKAPSAFPNQFVPTHVGETMATGVEQPQQAAATVSPCRNRHVPVPPRFSAMLPKKTAGHADRQAGRLRPPRSSSHLPEHPRGDSGTGKDRGPAARAPGHTRHASGRTAFAHAGLCVSTAWLPPTGIKRFRWDRRGSVR